MVPFHQQTRSSSVVARDSSRRSRVISLSEEDAAYLDRLPLDRFPLPLRPGRIVSDLVRIDVDAAGYRSLVATRRVEPGKLVVINDGATIDHPLRYSIQIGDGLHRVGIGGVEHSCTPNARIDDRSHAVVTLRAVLQDEAITLNYLCTEEALAHSFVCSRRYDASERECYGTIAGFRHLDPVRRARLLRELPVAPFLRKKYAQ